MSRKRNSRNHVLLRTAILRSSFVDLSLINFKLFLLLSRWFYLKQHKQSIVLIYDHSTNNLIDAERLFTTLDLLTAKRRNRIQTCRSCISANVVHMNSKPNRDLQYVYIREKVNPERVMRSIWVSFNELNQQQTEFISHCV